MRWGRDGGRRGPKSCGPRRRGLGLGAPRLGGAAGVPAVSRAPAVSGAPLVLGPQTVWRAPLAALLAALLALAVAVAPAPPAAAWSGVWLSLGRPNPVPTPGATFTTELLASTSGAELGALDLVLGYDPGVVEVLGVSIPANSPFDPPACAVDTAGTPGRVRLTAYEARAPREARESTPLAVITWRAVGQAGAATDVTLEPAAVVEGQWRPVEVAASGRRLVVQAVAFSDMVGHWAEDTVYALVARGVVSGYPGGLFRPEEPITRAQAAVMVASLLQLAPGQEADLGFADRAGIPSWAVAGVAAAAREGLVRGYPRPGGGEAFEPARAVTRAEMAALACRIMERELGPAATVELAFLDAAEIPAWARAAVGAALAGGIVSGYPDSTFRPQNRVTRAEAATMFWRVLSLLEGAAPGAGAGGQGGDKACAWRCRAGW